MCYTIFWNKEINSVKQIMIKGHLMPYSAILRSFQGDLYTYQTYIAWFITNTCDTCFIPFSGMKNSFRWIKWRKNVIWSHIRRFKVISRSYIHIKRIWHMSYNLSMWHTFNIIFSDEGGRINQVYHSNRSFENKICHFNGVSMSLQCRAFMSKMIGVCFITFTGDTCFPVQGVICI